VKNNKKQHSKTAVVCYAYQY